MDREKNGSVKFRFILYLGDEVDRGKNGSVKFRFILYLGLKSKPELMIWAWTQIGSSYRTRT